MNRQQRKAVSACCFTACFLAFVGLAVTTRSDALCVVAVLGAVVELWLIVSTIRELKSPI